MSPKNLALSAAAIAVAGMAVYLFIQVKASPAQAHQATTTTATARPSHAPERSAEPTAIAPTASPTPPRATPTLRATPTPTPVAQARPSSPEAAVVEDPAQRPNLKLDSMMELANKAYDAQDFDQATAIAGKVLAKDPTNVRMLRIMVSANCIAGDSVIAQQHYERLPKFDREQMKTRCDRYGVSFKDPPE